MATKRIVNLTAITSPVHKEDAFAASIIASDVDRKVSFEVLLNSMGFASSTVAGLPGGTAGVFLFVTDGRKIGEGAAAGTGVLVSWNGSNWVTVDAGTAVSA